VSKAKGLKLDSEVYKPNQLGRHKIHVDLEELVDYIDWTFFFLAWDMKMTYPKILEDPNYGKEAKKLFADAKELLQKIIDEKLLKAVGYYGIFPIEKQGDDIHVAGSDIVFHTFRQQRQQKNDVQISLTDYLSEQDYMGAFAVTAGIGVDELVAKYNEDHDEYNSILVKVLADRLAEAFAEYLHHKIRTDYWGYNEQVFTPQDLFKGKYQGIRPAIGYPSLPDHSEKKQLFELLEIDDITLTESFLMQPLASVSGLYFSHPKSEYFDVFNIEKDQVIDYASRKNIEVSQVEKMIINRIRYK
jgi:5-methyltetrahydrofolate--homocysteine methyltransferase